MENKIDNSDIKTLLGRSSDVNTSDDFTLNLMQDIEALESVKVNRVSYFKISFVLIAVATLASFYVVNYFSTLSCQLIKTNCQVFQYFFASILALLILGQFNFLLTRLKQDKHTLAQ